MKRPNFLTSTPHGAFAWRGDDVQPTKTALPIERTSAISIQGTARIGCWNDGRGIAEIKAEVGLEVSAAAEQVPGGRLEPSFFLRIDWATQDGHEKEMDGLGIEEISASRLLVTLHALRTAVTHAQLLGLIPQDHELGDRISTQMPNPALIVAR